MKFRSRLTSDGAATLCALVSSAQKLAPSGAVLLSEAAVRLAVAGAGAGGEGGAAIDPACPRAFAELASAALFAECRIESQSGNVILFELELEHLSTALSKSMQFAQCQIKLVKRDNKGVLCFEAKAVGGALEVVHDVPIRLLRPSELARHMPPDVRPPQVALELPGGYGPTQRSGGGGKAIKMLVDKLSKLSRYIYIDAEQRRSSRGDAGSGSLVLRVDASSASVRSHISGLKIGRSEYASEGNLVSEASVKVDARRLSVVLACNQLNAAATSTLYITEDEAIVLHLTLSPEGLGSATYYLPVIVDGEAARQDLHNDEDAR